MTTAHRPTFDPARGKDAQRGPAYHQRLLPAHTVLKHRQTGQGGVGGLGAPRDLRAELLKAEAAVKARNKGGALPEPKSDNEDNTSATKRKLITHDADAEEEEDPEVKRRRLILEEAADVDADSDSASDAASEADSSSSDSESEDEEAELLRELAKIKAERAAQRAAEEAKQAAEEQERREVDIALGNPLLNKQQERQDFGVKRRWDDDVVFRNQARGTEERAKGRKEFVNDLLRSDFHKRFMGRYVR